jgi:SAM-dependent methyltransferase
MLVRTEPWSSVDSRCPAAASPLSSPRSIRSSFETVKTQPCVVHARLCFPAHRLDDDQDMPLVDLASVASLLVCPRCGSSLAERQGSFQCSSPACALATADAFPNVGGCPAIIDFEQSIVQRGDVETTRQAGSSPRTPRRWSLDRLPPSLRSWWKPTNKVAAKNVELLLSLLSAPSPLVLVIGGGTMGNGVEALYAERGIRLLAFDIYRSPLTQLVADAHRIPLANESVDAVLVQAVLEHVLDPGQVVKEIERVLARGGLVYAETPFLQQVHAGPYDFMRFTSSGHRYLFRAFEELSAGPVAGPGTQLLWSVDHLTRGLLRSQLLGKLVRGLFFWLRFLDRLVPEQFVMDDASAYYFLGRRSDRELAPHEIVEYYRGAQRTGGGRRLGGGGLEPPAGRE